MVTNGNQGPDVNRFAVLWSTPQNSAIYSTVISRESEGMISFTFVDLERPDQGHLLKNTVSVRDSAIVTIKHK